jgi:hypothetical protein
LTPYSLEQALIYRKRASVTVTLHMLANHV